MSINLCGSKDPAYLQQILFRYVKATNIQPFCISLGWETRYKYIDIIEHLLLKMVRWPWKGPLGLACGLVLGRPLYVGNDSVAASWHLPTTVFRCSNMTARNQDWSINPFSLLMFLDLSLAIDCPIEIHTFLIRFKSGDWAGHARIWTVWSFLHFLSNRELCSRVCCLVGKSSCRHWRVALQQAASLSPRCCSTWQHSLPYQQNEDDLDQLCRSSPIPWLMRDVWYWVRCILGWTPCLTFFFHGGFG